MSINVIFTGTYRDQPSVTDMSLHNRVDKFIDNGIKNVYWYTWNQRDSDIMLRVKEIITRAGITIKEIDEPFPHDSNSIRGRQRQIYNIKEALKDFSQDDIILKLRWDLDFNDKLLKNIQEKDFFDKVENGDIGNKIWVGFYSIQEMFSPADFSFAGYKRDLDKLINFKFQIDGVSSDNYISHDGMMLMPKLISANKEVCNLIREDTPTPASLMFKESHINDDRYLNAWAYSYHLLHKYFKTGPLGSCYFKRGDQARWPHSFVDYENFLHNYHTITGVAPRPGPYPKYRVYDDIFIERLVSGYYSDPFSTKLYKIIKERYNE